MKKQTRNKTISKFKSAVAGIIFPCRCPYCHIVIRRDEYACKKCADKLPKIVYHRFAIGGAPCASPLPYLNEYANAVKRFKFSGKGYLAQAFSFLIAKAVRESYGEYSFDFITCVPMHQKDKTRRGYNQAELLARACAEIMGFPFEETLEKFKRTKPQHKINAKERIKNVRGAFRLLDSKSVKGKHVLLIDDIITTGNTLGECAKVLLQGKCRFVSCAVVCTTAVNYSEKKH